jgi:hypothetical protein
LATFARTCRRAQRAIVLPLAAHGVLRVGKLACATPFAAFAAFARAILPLSAALTVVVAAWIINQAIGFGVLGYPVELNTFLWGFAIGAAAHRDRGIDAGTHLPSIGRPVELALALLAAYVAYEAVLLAFTPVLGGTGAFTVAIIARIGLLNVLCMIGLVAAYELLKAFALKHQEFVT